MKRLQQYIFLFFIMFFGTMMFQQQAFGEESATSNEMLEAQSFVYEIKYPENQQDDSGYFNLMIEPGKQQVIQIILRNLSDKEIDIKVDLNGAKTNSNGVVEYGPNEIESDPSLKYDFTDIVKAQEIVTLPANGEMPVDFTITMPEVSYDGLIVGGIQLQQIEKEEDETDTTGNKANIVNRYAYIIALVLQETNVEIQPDLVLNKVSASQSNYRNAIAVNVSNVAPVFLKDLMMEVQISGSNNDEVLFEAKKSAMKMAPNSFMEFPVSMNGEQMKPGEYKAKILATSGSKKWEWTETFTISKSEADKFNQDDVGIVQDTGLDWLLIISIIGGIILVAAVVFLVVHQLRKKNRRKRNGEKK
ncbi:DUF916 and DUF3324 domain-containing protein [Enterococcus sp. LJL51]|uniref:DUF916 and DUF3324 domain-containing protein n=1 Tax=Enterococcus sp. LJL51 TaxID=3416656 RepID=UPI003CEFA5E8